MSGTVNTIERLFRNEVMYWIDAASTYSIDNTTASTDETVMVSLIDRLAKMDENTFPPKKDVVFKRVSHKMFLSLLQTVPSLLVRSDVKPLRLQYRLLITFQNWLTVSELRKAFNAIQDKQFLHPLNLPALYSPEHSYLYNLLYNAFDDRTLTFETLKHIVEYKTQPVLWRHPSPLQRLFEFALQHKSFRPFPSFVLEEGGASKLYNSHQIYMTSLNPDKQHSYQRSFDTQVLDGTIQLLVRDTTQCEKVFSGCEPGSLRQHPLFSALFVWLATLHMVDMYAQVEHATGWSAKLYIATSILPTNNPQTRHNTIDHLYVSLLPDTWTKSFRKDMIEVIRQTTHSLELGVLAHDLLQLSENWLVRAHPNVSRELRELAQEYVQESFTVQFLGQLCQAFTPELLQEYLKRLNPYSKCMVWKYCEYILEHEQYVDETVKELEKAYQRLPPSSPWPEHQQPVSLPDRIWANHVELYRMVEKQIKRDLKHDPKALKVALAGLKDTNGHIEIEAVLNKLYPKTLQLSYFHKMMYHTLHKQENHVDIWYFKHVFNKQLYHNTHAIHALLQAELDTLKTLDNKCKAIIDNRQTSKMCFIPPLSFQALKKLREIEKTHCGHYMGGYKNTFQLSQFWCGACVKDYKSYADSQVEYDPTNHLTTGVCNSKFSDEINMKVLKYLQNIATMRERQGTKCFGEPDEGHKQQIKNLEQSMAKCYSLIDQSKEKNPLRHLNRQVTL